VINNAEQEHLDNSTDYTNWVVEKVLSAECFKQVALRAAAIQERLDNSNVSQQIIKLLKEKENDNK